MDTITYRSRIDIGALAILFVVSAILYVGAFNTDTPAIGLTILGLLWMAIAFCYFSIQYTISRHKLTVSFKPFFNTTLDIASITKIKEAEGFEKAASLSVNRLMILTRSGDYVIVSPQNTAGFIRELKYRNGEIRVEADI
ncbi:MAG: PH domain-containing protein [Chitinophagaceae bacterium]|nr:PH domain-containing protein [Chitinophagaceae bacterium]MCB9045475.1 PH domain-containing protein [Chitinophagales bacterium]